MKMFSGVARFVGCQPGGWTFLYPVLFLGAAMFIVSCGKKSETPPVNTTQPAPTIQSSSQPGAPASAASAQPAAQTTNAAAASPDLQKLNQQMIRWIVQTHQRPKSFEDFVTRANIQVPPPPAGKKYIIDKRGFIALVDSSTN